MLQQPGHRALPRAGLAAGLDGGGAAGPPLHQSQINILVSWPITDQYYLNPDVAAAASPLDLELEGGILPDDGVRLVGAEQHVGGLAREEANTGY